MKLEQAFKIVRHELEHDDTSCVLRSQREIVANDVATYEFEVAVITGDRTLAEWGQGRSVEQQEFLESFFGGEGVRMRIVVDEHGKLVTREFLKIILS